MTLFDTAIATARQHQDLTVEQTSHLIHAMLSGQTADGEIGDLLLALRDKGEAVDELVGAALALRSHMTRIPHSHSMLLDTCGTGGSGTGTFNISTAVAILAASCGVPVAKHGNRRATSYSGSADVLEALGVKIALDAQAVARRLDAIGICFCFAPLLHPAMKHVAAIRRQLGVRTLFNYLGPLCNPASATHQLLGTSSAEMQPKIAAALSQLGTTRAFVVHADDGQDEVSLGAHTRVIDIHRDASGELTQTSSTLTAQSFGLAPVNYRELFAGDPVASAEIILDIFNGKPGPHRDTVVAGTATALVLVGQASDLLSAVKIAEQHLDNGAAREKLALCQSDQWD